MLTWFFTALIFVIPLAAAYRYDSNRLRELEIKRRARKCRFLSKKHK